MSNVFVTGMAWADVSSWSLAQIAAVKAKLTILPKRTHSKQTEEQLAPMEMYSLLGPKLGMPREYYMRVRSLTDAPEYRIKTGRPWSVRPEPNPKYVLRDDQPDCVESMLERLKPPFGGGIFEAPTGWGKTIVALEIARRIGQLTVILVPTSKIRDAWLAGAKDYFMGALRVGIVQEDRYDEDADILVAMMDSMTSRDELSCYELAGLVIADEVHHLGGRVWGRVIPRFKGPYRIGCSARAHRKDGCDRLFIDHIGPRVFRATVRRIEPEVYFRYTGWKPITTPNFNPEKVGDATLLKMLCGSEWRNKMIVADIVKASQTGRKIIVFSDRRTHLDKMRDIWAKTRPNGKTDGFLRGGMNKKDLALSDKCDVLWATYPFAKEGYDNQDIDTVVLASPVGDPEQPVGRGTRFKPGKKNVIVLDYVEEWPMFFSRRFEGRKRVYQRIGAKLPGERR